MTKSRRRACTPDCIRLDRPRPLRKPRPYGKRRSHRPPHPRFAVDRRGAVATVGRWRPWHGLVGGRNLWPRGGHGFGQSDVGTGCDVHRHLDHHDHPRLALCLDRFGDRPDRSRATRRESPGSGTPRRRRSAATIQRWHPGSPTGRHRTRSASGNPGCCGSGYPGTCSGRTSGLELTPTVAAQHRQPTASSGRVALSLCLSYCSTPVML